MVQYLSGERIQGSSTGGITPTYETVFTSDDFSDTGSKIVVNTGSGTFTWDGIQDGSTHGSTKDLTSISDTTWVIRFKLRINTLTAPNSASNRVTIGLFSTNSATAGDTNQDGIGLMIQNDTSTNQFWAQYRDGGNLMNGVQAFALTPATGTDYYIEIKRLTSTTGSVAIFPDNTYGTATETESITVAATTETLRYFGAKIRTGPAVGGTFDGYIDDLKIYNGTTSAVDEKVAITNVPVGTRYEETDTRKIYRRKASGGAQNTNIFNLTYSTEKQAAITAGDDPTGKCVVTHNASNPESRAYATFGTSGNTKTFEIKFTIERKSGDTGNNWGIWFGSDDWNDDSAGGSDKMIFARMVNGNEFQFSLEDAAGTNEDDTMTIQGTGTTKYYTITGNGTTAKCEYWASSDRSGSADVSSGNVSFPTNWLTRDAIDKITFGGWGGGGNAINVEFREVSIKWDNGSEASWVERGTA